MEHIDQEKGGLAASELQRAFNTGELSDDEGSVLPGIEPRADAVDEAEVRTELLRRITAAGVTTLGQVATIVTADGVYGVDAGVATQEVEAPGEVDTYPWSDAATWYAAGNGPDDLVVDEANAVDSALLHELFGAHVEAELGSRETMGWCGLFRHDERPGGAILQENQYGRRSAWLTDSDDELTRRWQELEAEHQVFKAATQQRNHETASGIAPEIWVGSLADYAAGVLHGVWLDATLEPEELTAAVQFMLRNSYEPDAEEYGVFDYDGFGQGLASLLGEYPSLETVSKVAQGIAEHGEAFAAWAAYVGPERHEQLERFEDHYLGEWDSMEAYAENYLEECEAFRLVDEAPEWLRPYIQVDVDGYARDLEIELHVADKAGGGVFVFDASA